MKTASLVPLSALLAFDDALLPQYRAAVATAYHAVFQAIESGGFSPAVRKGFPAMRKIRKRLGKTAAQLFAMMGRSQLNLWCRDFASWLAALPAPDRDRLVNTPVIEP